MNAVVCSRRGGALGALVVAVATVFATAAAASAAAGDLQLVSRAAGPGGAKGNDGSGAAALASTGRLVVFSSNATNLHPDDPDASSDIFVRDLQTSAVTLASRASGAAGAKGNGNSGVASISADGRFVVFVSSATNLAPEDADATSDVYLRDLVAETTTLMSRASGAGAKSNNDSFTPSVSADGRFAAFASNGSNLDPDDADARTDVFVRDLTSGGLTLVSRATGVRGVKGGAGSASPRMSADGARVVFSSNAANLDPDDLDEAPDVFVRDVAAGVTTLVSRATGGGASDSDSFTPTISADGRFVAFGSSATNLHPGDTDGITDVFVRDVLAGTTALASRAGGTGGQKGNGFTDEPAITADGRAVVFVSNSTNLHPDDTDVLDDVFVRDLVGSSTRLVSRGSALTKGNGFSVGASISGNGDVVTFVSSSANLAPDDADTIVDVFVRDVSSAPAGPAAGGTILRPQPGCPQRGLQIIGTPRDDLRSGTALIDVMFGLAGNDTLRALAGADCMFGAEGRDRLFGGPGDDLLFGEIGNDTLLGEAGNDRLSGGTGKDALSGAAGNDRLFGETGNDRLTGAAGMDQLDGGAGNDTLTDPAGLDRFSGGAGADRINSRDRKRSDRLRRDIVRCGRGRDVALVDRRDRVARDCERVRRR